MSLLENPAMLWLCASFGDALVIVGIVTAALCKQIRGFTPVTWILLAVVLYLYCIMSLAARILVNG
jgi:hypothetical protein